jgi:tocopherol cyclase
VEKPQPPRLLSSSELGIKYRRATGHGYPTPGLFKPIQLWVLWPGNTTPTRSMAGVARGGRSSLPPGCSPACKSLSRAGRSLWPTVTPRGGSSGRGSGTSSPGSYYSEKNWGRSFPQKWFWLNCNALMGCPTSPLPLGGSPSSAGLDGVGGDGRHSPRRQVLRVCAWNAQVTWHITPWGYWHMRCDRPDYVVEVTGTSNLPGIPLRAPTHQGMAFCCRDTALGDLSLSFGNGGAKN